MTLTVVLDISPRIAALLENFCMPAFDELSSKIDAIAAALDGSKAAILDAVATESAQVAAAIAALEAQLGNVLTPAEFTAVSDKLEALKGTASLDGLKTAVGAIYEPPVAPTA